MKTLVFLALIFLVALGAVPARAMPPYSHERVVKWENANIKSDIPEPNRVYVLWPDNGPGVSGGPSGTPVLQPSYICHIVPFTTGLTLKDVLRHVPADSKKVLGMNIYRAGTDYTPVLSARRGEEAIAHFAMQPSDIIHLFYIDPSVPLRPNN